MNPASCVSETKLSRLNMDYYEEEEEEDKTYAYAAVLINSCMLPMVIKTTIEMGVLKIIHAEAGSTGLSAAEITARIAAAQNPDAAIMVDRILRLLATYSVVSCKTVPTARGGGVERRYGPTHVTKCFVPDLDGVPLPVADLGQKCKGGQVHYKNFVRSKLTDAVLQGGIPFDKVHGMPFFEYMGVTSRLNEVFNKGMYDHSTYVIKKILKRYEGFENIQQLVDVGGGLGHTLHHITSQYPFIRGINFDLPHVVVHAPIIPGVDHVSGNMFETVPKGDAIFIKSILHNWSDDHCLTLLKNCYEALPLKGKVIIVETNILDEPDTTSLTRAITQYDVMMMAHFGGKERTSREFEALAKAVGIC